MFGSSRFSWSQQWQTANNFLKNNIAERNKGVLFSNIENYADEGDAASSIPGAGSVSQGSSGCSGSSDCASGWRCINGECVPPRNTPGDPTGGGNDYGCGGGGGGGSSTSSPSGGGGSQCAGGTSQIVQSSSATGSGNAVGGCAINTPGGNGCGGGGYDGGPGYSYPDSDTGCDANRGETPPGDPGACAGGSRCCRFNARYGSVRCGCGPCGQNDVECDRFCAGHAAATGSSAAGCSNPTECDECTTCESVGFSGTSTIYKCTPKDFGAPCYCAEGRECEECLECQSSGFCSLTPESLRACRPPEPPSNKEPEPDPKDECQRKCSYTNKCSSPGEGNPSCAPGQKLVGTISSSAGVCITCEYNCRQEGDCDPEPCDCNCDDQCPDCFICNPGSGKCDPDPNCEGGVYGVRYSYYSCGSQTCQSGQFQAGSCEPTTQGGRGCPEMTGVLSPGTDCGGNKVNQIITVWQWSDGEEFYVTIVSGFGFGTVLNYAEPIFDGENILQINSSIGGECG